MSDTSNTPKITLFYNEDMKNEYINHVEEQGNKNPYVPILIKRAKAIKYYKLTQYMANLFSKDPSTKVGALFMYPDSLQILSMGYNGMPRKIDETISERWERPQKYKWTEHAERNAIYNAACSGTPLRNSICVSTHFPCADCARGIIQSGCKMVISHDIKEFESDNPEAAARWKSDCDLSVEMLTEAGIQMMLIKKDELDEKTDIQTDIQKDETKTQ